MGVSLIPVSYGNGGGCDTTCQIVLGSVLGTVFIGAPLLYMLIRLIMKCSDENKKKQAEKEYRIEMERIDNLVTPFIQSNPHVLDMSDYTIPAYLQEQIPNLNAKDAQMSIHIIAKHRMNQV